MSSARRTFAQMAVLSGGTLALGLVRELVIARQLQASEAADLFFRGVVVVSAVRSFSLSLLRARWIPLVRAARPARLVRAAIRGATIVAILGLLGLLVVVPRDRWLSPVAAALAACVLVAAAGAIVRALAERHGAERRAVASDWLPLVGAIVGTRAMGGTGAIAGLALGLLVGTLVLVPAAIRDDPERRDDAVLGTSGMGVALIVDTLVYVNLGLLDGLLSMFVFAEGEFALVNYGYLFVNAVLAVPTAGATILALRAGGSAGADDLARLRRNAWLGAAIVAVLVGAIAIILAWPPTAALIDAAAGWSVGSQIWPLVAASVPFAALRLANTIARQARVAHDPAGLVGFDLVGLGLRATILWFGAQAFGPIASPIALGVAEAIQVGAWLRWRR